MTPKHKRSRAAIGLHAIPNEQAAMTYEDIGKQFGVSAARVRQIEKAALLKIRSAIAADSEMLQMCLDACDSPLSVAEFREGLLR